MSRSKRLRSKSSFTNSDYLRLCTLPLQPLRSLRLFGKRLKISRKKVVMETSRP